MLISKRVSHIFDNYLILNFVEEKIDTKNGNKKSKSSVKSGGKDRENKGSGKRLIESKKKRYSSTGNNQGN